MCWVIIAPDHNHWYTHTHTHTHLVGPLWTRDRPLPTHKIHKRSIHATGRIRSSIASNQAIADLRLRPCGHRNWRLCSYKLESDIGSGYVIVKLMLLLNKGMLCMCYITRLQLRYLSFVIWIYSVSSLHSASLKFPDWGGVTVVLVSLPYWARPFQVRDRELAALTWKCFIWKVYSNYFEAFSSVHSGSQLVIDICISQTKCILLE